MTTLSNQNAQIPFGYNFKESRMIKCLKIMEALVPGKFLDIGTTQGELLQKMARRGWTTEGVDVNFENVQKCRSIGLEVQLCDISVQALPFDKSYFDLIFAGEIIEHLVDTDSFIQELARCLKPNGSLIITTPNLASFENRIRLFFGVYPEWVDWCTTEGCGHVRSYTTKILKRQLIKHGFEISKVMGNFVPLVPQQFLNDLQFPPIGITGYLFPNLSQGIIVHAKRSAS